MVSAGVNKGRKLNSQASVDLSLFYNASCVWIFLLPQLYFCKLEKGGFKNVAESKLRCESDPSLSVISYTYSMWPARVVLGFWCCFFLPVQGTDTQTMKKLKLWSEHITGYSFWLLNQIVKGFKMVTSSHCFKKESLLFSVHASQGATGNHIFRMHFSSFFWKTESLLQQ